MTQPVDEAAQPTGAQPRREGSATVHAEVAAYLAGVQAALADLPAPTRRDLLEDLAEHLTEVAAESAGALADRLGPPAAYAAELRASAGVPPGRPSGAPALAAGLARLSTAGRAADVRVGRLLGHDRATEFARLLRPGWWVLRGYLAGVLAWTALADDGFDLRPQLSMLVPWLLLMAFAVWLSIWMGQRTSTWRRPGRVILAIGNVGLPLLVLVGLAQSTLVYGAPVEASYASHSDTSRLYPYDREGRALSGVRLVDEYGNEVLVGDQSYCDIIGVDSLDWQLDEMGARPGSGRLALRRDPDAPFDETDPNVLPACGAPHPYPRIHPLSSIGPDAGGPHPSEPARPGASPSAGRSPSPVVSPSPRPRPGTVTPTVRASPSTVPGP